MPMPRSSASRGLPRWSRSPRQCTAPVSGCRIPASTLSSVDLPAPFSPIRACASPSATPNVTPRSALTAPNDFLTSVNWRPVNGGVEVTPGQEYTSSILRIVIAYNAAHAYPASKRPRRAGRHHPPGSHCDSDHHESDVPGQADRDGHAQEQQRDGSPGDDLRGDHHVDQGARRPASSPTSMLGFDQSDSISPSRRRRTSARSSAATATASRKGSSRSTARNTPLATNNGPNTCTAATRASTRWSGASTTKEDRRGSSATFSLHQPGRRGRLSRQPGQCRHLHADRQERADHRLPRHDRQADAAQPDPAQLLQPRRRGLRHDPRPRADDQRRPLHAGGRRR